MSPYVVKRNMLLGKNLCPTPTPTPPPPNKKLIGFGSFEKVNLKLAGGVRTPGPPRPATPLIQTLYDIWVSSRFAESRFAETRFAESSGVPRVSSARGEDGKWRPFLSASDWQALKTLSLAMEGSGRSPSRQHFWEHLGVNGTHFLIAQGSHQPGKSGRVRESQGIWVVREKSGNFGWSQGKRRKEEKTRNK